MEPQSSETKTLVDLGLTLVQAKLYLALVKFGPAKISILSSVSNVARPQIYRNLSNLENLGLVERIIEMPTRYRAIPIAKGVKFLLKTKAEQFQKLRADTQILLDTAKTDKKHEQREQPRFVLIPKGRLVIDKINNSIEKAQLSMDFVLSWKRFSVGMVSTFAEKMENAWARNVKVRFILQQPPLNRTGKELVQFCRKRPCVQTKFISECPNTVFGIYDKKEVIIIVSSKTDLPSSPALWSNSYSLVALAQDYFELLWNESKESLD